MTIAILAPSLAVQIKNVVLIIPIIALKRVRLFLACAETYMKTAIIVMVAEMFVPKQHQFAAMAIAARQRIVVSLMTSLLVLM
jgi:hypothetical protein